MGPPATPRPTPSPTPSPTLSPTPSPTPVPVSVQASAGCDNSTGTCTVSEDPHVEVFDGAQVSLLRAIALLGATAASDSQAADKWLVKSDHVRIQARFAEDGSLANRNLFV